MRGSVAPSSPDTPRTPPGDPEGRLNRPFKLEIRFTRLEWDTLWRAHSIATDGRHIPGYEWLRAVLILEALAITRNHNGEDDD